MVKNRSSLRILIDIMQNLSWFPLSLAAGLLMGIGMILARTGASGMPSYIFVGILGIVWGAGSMSFAVVRHEPFNYATTIIVFAVLAGIFFWLENILRFNAVPKAPVTAYVLLTIEVVGVTLTLIYDFVRLYRAGKLDTVSSHEIIGLLLGAGAVTMFALAPKHQL